MQLTCGQITLREATSADDDTLVALMPDDFDHDPTFPTAEGRTLREHRAAWMRQWLAGFRSPQISKNRFLVFIVEHEGKPIGLQTLEGLNVEHTREWESTSFLVPSARGRRFGVAMRTAILTLAFEHLDALRAVSAARPDNVASRRVAERAGYRFVNRREPIVAGQPRPIDLYEMTRDMWFSHMHAPVMIEGIIAP